MSADTARPEIGQHLAMDALVNAIEKKWSGGYEVQAGSVIFAELWVFQKGAILGRARADKKNALVSLMAAMSSVI
jgi:hypothetical protein